jgi:hypothetical protein
MAREALGAPKEICAGHRGGHSAPRPACALGYPRQNAPARVRSCGRADAPQLFSVRLPADTNLRPIAALPRKPQRPRIGFGVGVPLTRPNLAASRGG